jgi:aspartate-semialdehyde dehydrogenase
LKTRTLTAGLLGSTGAVGQRYVSMLARHPYIRLEVLMGGQSSGKKYADAAPWMLPEQIPEQISAKVVRSSTPESARDCDVVFSALPSEAARLLEPKFARAGLTVVSEASAHRMDRDVPLMIPEVNAGHLDILAAQRKRRGWKGLLVTTPNCTVTGLALVMAPLLEAFECRKAIVTTMQAVSGAGFPGVASLQIVENVIPYIKDEEEKVASEARKILGSAHHEAITERELPMGVSCNRVPVLDGHMETLYSEFSTPVRPDEAAKVLQDFTGLPQKLNLPTAPDKPIIVRGEADRPQPRLDRMAGSVPGMSVTVGRVRQGVQSDSLQMTLLSHNTIRGAAGNAILTAELMHRQGWIGG